MYYGNMMCKETFNYEFYKIFCTLLDGLFIFAPQIGVSLFQYNVPIQMNKTSRQN